ncbi:MAG: serine/threonine protein kinase [Anaerolineae bacterium]|nr:serine/threonine protein kinase [Anaerolineae bacterium]
MADWAGKTLGKVHIDDLVARGGMAEVYTGTHESFGQVAVKVMRGLLERDSDQLARFQREAEVVEELRHPNIVQMFDYTVVDETPCLVMEYIPGPSLHSYLKHLHDNKQRLPIGIVGHILTSMASALDYAHAKGMVHRDIKPANVLLRSRSESVELDKPLPMDVEPVLTDFGLVRLLDSTMHTTAGSVSGTPTYMSPEQARGEKVDKRTDIYSFGIMLYEMLAGEVPFQSDTTFGMLMKHINDPPTPIKGISKDLQALLDRALAKDPSLRYESAGDLANEFMALFNGQTISPGTLHIAEMARKAAEASRKGQPAEDARPGRSLLQFGLGIVGILIVGLIILSFIRPQLVNLSITPTPTRNPNFDVGRLRFDDGGNIMDTFTISLISVDPPAEGKHYEGWLISNDGTLTRPAGPVIFNDAGIGRLEFTIPGSQNILANFNQIIITQEDGNIEDGTVVTEPSTEIVYSSIFPPEALIPIRRILVSDPDTPNEEALIQGLWFYGAQYINTSINGDVENDPEYVSLVTALEKGDELTFRKRTEEIINQIVGDASERFLDYDEDGNIEYYLGDAYGSLPAGDRPGYIQATVSNAQAAAEAADSTLNIRLFSQSTQTCVQNMNNWTNELLQLALQLIDMPFGPQMNSTVERMADLGTWLYDGNDVNNNGQIDTIPDECGITIAYDEAYSMADMLIYPGKDRTPPP